MFRSNPAATFARSSMRGHMALLAVPSAASLLFCMRPTMSKLRYAVTCASGIGGFVTNAFEPTRPISSPDQSANTTLRRIGGCGAPDKARPPSNSAIAITAAVPEALSSAP